MSIIRIWHHDSLSFDRARTPALVYNRQHYFETIEIPDWPTLKRGAPAISQGASRFIQVLSDVDVLIDINPIPDASNLRARFVSAGELVWFEVRPGDLISVMKSQSISGITSQTDSANAGELSEVLIAAPGDGFYTEIDGIYPTVAGNALTALSATVQVLSNSIDLLYEAILPVPVLPDIIAPVLAPLSIAIAENTSALIKIASSVSLPANTMNVRSSVRALSKPR